VLHALDKDESRYAAARDDDESDSSSSSSSSASPAPQPKGLDLLKQTTNRLMNATRAFRREGVEQKHTKTYGNWFDRGTTLEERAFVSRLLSSAQLMRVSSTTLRGFHTPLFADGAPVDRQDLANIASKSIHQLKVWTAQIAYRFHNKPNVEALKVAAGRHEALTATFRETRTAYLKELAYLRDMVKLRQDPLANIDAFMEVRQFWDPVIMLSPVELKFLKDCVEEKLKMIFENNPTVAKTVDLGQIERLRTLVESNECTELRAALSRKMTALTSAEKEIVNLNKKKNKLEVDLEKKFFLDSTGEGGCARTTTSNSKFLEKLCEDLRNQLWEANKKIKELGKSEKCMQLDREELKLAYEKEQTERCMVQMMNQKMSNELDAEVHGHQQGLHKAQAMEDMLNLNQREVEALRRSGARFRMANKMRPVQEEAQSGAPTVEVGEGLQGLLPSTEADAAGGGGCSPTPPGQTASQRTSLELRGRTSLELRRKTDNVQDLQGLLTEAEDERIIAVDSQAALLTENEALREKCRDLATEANSSFNDMIVMNAEKALDDVESLEERVEALNALQKLGSDEYGGANHGYRICNTCRSVFMADAKYCRGCGGKRPNLGEGETFSKEGEESMEGVKELPRGSLVRTIADVPSGNPGSEYVIPAGTFGEVTDGDEDEDGYNLVKFDGVGEHLVHYKDNSKLKVQQEKAQSAEVLYQDMHALSGNLAQVSQELREELQAEPEKVGTEGANPAVKALWQKIIFGKQIQIASLQRQIAKTDALLTVARVREAMTASREASTLAEVDGPPACKCGRKIEIACGCQPEKDAMRAALAALERFCAELTAKYHASAAENKRLHESLNRVQQQLNNVADIMKGSKAMKNNVELQECLKQIQRTSQQTVFDRLWADAKAKEDISGSALERREARLREKMLRRQRAEAERYRKAMGPAPPVTTTGSSNHLPELPELPSETAFVARVSLGKQVTVDPAHERRGFAPNSSKVLKGNRVSPDDLGRWDSQKLVATGRRVSNDASPEPYADAQAHRPADEYDNPGKSKSAADLMLTVFSVDFPEGQDDAPPVLRPGSSAAPSSSPPKRSNLEHLMARESSPGSVASATPRTSLTRLPVIGGGSSSSEAAGGQLQELRAVGWSKQAEKPSTARGRERPASVQQPVHDPGKHSSSPAQGGQQFGLNLPDMSPPLRPADRKPTPGGVTKIKSSGRRPVAVPPQDAHSSTGGGRPTLRSSPLRVVGNL